MRHFDAISDGSLIYSVVKDYQSLYDVVRK
jgi:hypothetical protein